MSTFLRTSEPPGPASTLQPPLGIDGRPATIAHGCSRLPVALVGHLPDREHPGHARRGALIEGYAAVDSSTRPRLLQRLFGATETNGCTILGPWDPPSRMSP